MRKSAAFSTLPEGANSHPDDLLSAASDASFESHIEREGIAQHLIWALSDLSGRWESYVGVGLVAPVQRIGCNPLYLWHRFAGIAPFLSRTAFADCTRRIFQ